VDNPPPPAVTHAVGGAVAGLAAGTQLTLQDNGGDSLVLKDNGAFTFATAITEGGGYAITVSAQPAGQTCTVSNGSGSNISADVNNVAVACGVTTHAITAKITGVPAGSQLELVDNDGDPLTINTDGTFTFATPIVDMAAFAVRVSRRPLGAVCSVTNGTGSSVTTDVTNISVDCTAVRGFGYVANLPGSASAPGAVSQYNLGPSGTVVPMTTPSVDLGSTSGVAVDPTGRYLYVANRGTKKVDFFAIGAADGSLTPITDAATGNTSAATGTIPEAIVITPNGKFVYVPNQSPGSVSQYAVQSNGSLTPVGTGPSTPSGSISMAIDPTGKYAYVANGPGNSISQFSIGSDGALAPITGSGGVTNVPNPGYAASVAVDHGGKFLYVANYFSNSVGEYAIGADGSLTPLMSGGTAITIPAGTNPVAVVIDPSGKYLYASNSGGTSHSVSQYSIDANSGVLTHMADWVTPDATQPFYTAFDSANENAYLVSGGKVQQFTVGAVGSLTTTGTPVAAGTNPQMIAVTR
jgi:6-phosphogluconolactonase (cycloisomerase 2 family)